ncbi:MAG: extracellular solute-binding protein [Spirochaetales bacterium]|nr:extracellular solute-binding protein [Spirochaetales bacterium]
MKGKILVVLLLLVVSFSVFATGEAESDEQSVVLYSAHNQEIIDALVPRFEAATGIKAEVVKMGSSDVIARVKAEQGNPQCDVIWSIGGEQLEANSALLQNYEPEGWDKVEDVFKVGTNWLPYTGIVMVFIVNTDLISDSMTPRKWTDLSDPRLKGMISSARADKSGSSYMQLATVLNIYKNNGWDVYKDILGNFVLSGSSSAVSRFVNDGEAAVGLTLEDNAYLYVEGGGPVKIVYPEDGTTAAPDGIAMVKDGPNPDAAKAFIDWALSKETQDFLVEKMGRRPVRTDSAISPDLPPMSDINTVPYDFAWSASSKQDFVAKWTEIVQELGL